MRALARLHGINPKTVAEWKKRESNTTTMLWRIPITNSMKKQDCTTFPASTR
jgi:hypothetical protein